jgi:geranylgeranyl diphosphate synthase type II
LIERYIAHTLSGVSGNGGPPRLAEAMHHAVFPGGARFRPRLCLAVARACGNAQAPGAMAAAAAIELLHCASLVHDDLPCFDNADLRRGVPSVHRAYGERLAVLSGDALIVLAFQAVAQERAASAAQRLELISLLTSASGMPCGIAAGQAWECEPRVGLSDYQRAKTGALFAAATAAGAVAAGADHRPWLEVGECLGEAYQVADDIGDVAGSSTQLGKPTGRDAALGRPNVVSELGLSAAQSRFQQLIDSATRRIPSCPGASELRTAILNITGQLLLGRQARSAA